MKQNLLLSWLVLICCFFLFTRCANQVAPQGGKKDTVPPKVTECIPENYTTNFSSKEIRITYDEFIQLKDPTTQILISPPDLSNPDIHLRGKSLLIDFKDKLRPNTTYSVNFGNAISDITENNVNHDFSYVFSTGNYVDSLSLKGMVLDAFDHKPQKDILVMLYTNENDTIPFDSLPCKVRPYYLAKTNENGGFTFHNIRNTSYLLFALKDQDGDFIYNLPNEKVAFSDSLVRGIYIKPEKHDTIRKDSIAKKDSIFKKDSAGKISQDYSAHVLMLFEKIDSNQRLLKSIFVKDGQLSLIFRFPLVAPSFIPLKPDLPVNWCIEEYNKTRDTINLWTNNHLPDTVELKISDNGKVIDTARITHSLKAEKKKAGKTEEGKKDRLAVAINSIDGRVNQFRGDPQFSFFYPLSSFRPAKALLIQGKDTSKANLVFVDSVKRKIRVSHKWKEDMSYRIFVPDSVFFSINNLTNDTTRWDFKTRAEKDFGTLLLNIVIKNPGVPYIIQLLTEKDLVVEQRIIKTSGKVKFEFLPPGKYTIKVIVDKNNNGRWDTGDYAKKIQPEPVDFFPKTIEVRSNWEIEESWEL